MGFIPKKRLERAASDLLAEFRQARPQALETPVPVEEILEGHLGLTLSFTDLTAALGRDDVLGATFVERREVSIDRRLDPDENPGCDGRFRFTVAHEIGHWLLHAPSLGSDGVTHALRRKRPRRTDKDPLEWQADYFAACLLMPSEALRQQWEARALEDEALQVGEVARLFEVSEQAMRIRLHDLALLSAAVRS